MDKMNKSPDPDTMETKSSGLSEEDIEYQLFCEMQEYCTKFEPSYNPEDGSM
jgi:hypothetical protein